MLTICIISASKPVAASEDEQVDPASKHSYENVAVTDGQVRSEPNVIKCFAALIYECS
jgi:hypothetical protein